MRLPAYDIRRVDAIDDSRRRVRIEAANAFEQPEMAF